VLTLIIGGQVDAQRPGSGTRAPDFTLPTLDSSTVHLAALHGHPVIIAFWATWCRPCQQEMPELASLYRAHLDDSLGLLAVNSGREKEAKIRRFVERLALPYPILLDHKQKTFMAYAAFGLPLTVSVDAAGLIRYRVQGPITPSQFDAGLQTILPGH
jgi:peroxiredoxin